MIDSSLGGISLCTLVGTAHQESLNGYVSKAADRDDNVMKERDYISLGLTGASQAEAALTRTPSAIEKMECDNVVLSLGLCLPDNAASLQEGGSPQEQQASFNGTPKSQHFWHQNFRVSLSNDHLQYMASRTKAEAMVTPSFGKGTYTLCSSVPGRLAVPAPKVSTIPAKRPYQDAKGERAQGSRQLPTALPTTSSFKVPHAVSNVSMPPPSSNKSAPSSSQIADISSNPFEREHDGNHNKAPVVGWPPVRSSRKNTLQASQISYQMSTEDLSKSKGGPSISTALDVSEHMNDSINKNAFFVKAKLDGVRICRKVDLKVSESYDGLKVALQDMFQGFVSDNAKLDLLTGNNYVVTYEDKDGDCLLVGDVPWNMFLESSVKSIRIMKSIDATSIGEKASAKLNAPGSHKPS